MTFDPGLQRDVTWSPDGRAIAYTSDKAGNFDIWVQRLDSGQVVQITTSPAQDTQPTWSADGSTIVFRSEREGGGLFAVPATGAAERRLTSFGFRPRWAPDGSQILFASTDAFASEVSTRLYTVGLNGLAPHEVLRQFFDDKPSVVAWACTPIHSTSRCSGRIARNWGCSRFHCLADRRPS